MRHGGALRESCPRRYEHHHLCLLFPESTPARVLALVVDQHRLVLTRWIINELHDVVGSKRPDLLPALAEFLDGIDHELAEPGNRGVLISDPDDQPILDAAVSSEVDVIVTGYKHFLQLTLDQPRVLTARAFLNEFA